MKISLISLTVICVLLCNVVEGKRKQPDYEWKRNFGGSQNVTEIAMVKDETDSTTGDIDTTIIVKTMVFGRRREKNSNVRGSYTQFFFPAKGAAKMVTRTFVGDRRLCLIQDTTETKASLTATLAARNGTFVADIAADPVYFNVTGMADVTDADLSARSSCRKNMVVETLTDPVPQGKLLISTINGKMAFNIPPKKNLGRRMKKVVKKVKATRKGRKMVQGKRGKKPVKGMQGKGKGKGKGKGSKGVSD